MRSEGGSVLFFRYRGEAGDLFRGMRGRLFLSSRYFGARGQVRLPGRVPVQIEGQAVPTGHERAKEVQHLHVHFRQMGVHADTLRRQMRHRGRPALHHVRWQALRFYGKVQILFDEGRELYDRERKCPVFRSDIRGQRNYLSRGKKLTRKIILSIL